MLNAQSQPDHFVSRLLRGVQQLPQIRFEIFHRLYVQGLPASQVMQDLGLDESAFERECSAMLRSLASMK